LIEWLLDGASTQQGHWRQSMAFLSISVAF
jgi:hypothetical protein